MSPKPEVTRRRRPVMSRKAWISLALVGLLGCGAGAAVYKHSAGAPPPARTGQTVSEPSGPPIDLVELPPADQRIRVPGFAGSGAWLNVDHALGLDELAGRAVLVDFFTSCCINCMQTIPTLQKIEERFHGQPLVVVGVHSPKFEEEQELERLRDFVRDNRLVHPVASDGSMAVWKAWGIEGWPTLVLLDVEGKAIWGGSGEPDEKELTSLIASVIEEGRAKGKLAKGELRGLRREPDTSGPLRYPGKVLALADGGLAVSDTGHDRVVLLDRAGAVTAVIGTGSAGPADGAFDGASFDRPEGLTEDGGSLYVADTGNHMLRKIDRQARTVVTVAGTGALGMRRLGPEEVPATEFALRSPWDVLSLRGTIYVALAGSHQIAAFDPRRGTLRLFAGNGREAREDGPTMGSSFAQPSALATDGKEIFVLDSETSSVRAIDPAKGKVRTVVGEDLFVFGDVDGDRTVARLQHPIGLAYAEGALWVADSYNSKLKRVDPVTGATKSILGGRDRKVLDEPAGLTIAGGFITIADTNHHRLVRTRLGGSALEPIALAGLEAPRPKAAPVHVDPSAPIASLGTLRVPAGKPSRLHVGWKLPQGTGVNEAAPFRVVWAEMRGLTRVPEPLRTTGASAQQGFDFSVEPAAGASSGSLIGVLDLVICDIETHRVCVPVRRTLKADFAVADAPDQGAVATVELPAAR